MVELHGWLSISETYEDEDNYEEVEIDSIMQEVKRIVADKDSVEIEYKNGVPFISTLICTNHRTPEIDLVINTYKLVSETATGSYGLIYIRDDEDSVHHNEFQIYIFKKGECHYKVDNDLSPCIPEVENGDCYAG